MEERISQQISALEAALGLMVATGEIKKETKQTIELALAGIRQIVRQEIALQTKQ